jgi:hypothetical protein
MKISGEPNQDRRGSLFSGARCGKWSTLRNVPFPPWGKSFGNRSLGGSVSPTASLDALKKKHFLPLTVTEPVFLDFPGKKECRMRDFSVSEILLFAALDCKVQYSRKIIFFLIFLQKATEKFTACFIYK